MSARLRLAVALAASMLAGANRAAPALTDTEQRWLDGATPALAWGLQQGLPIDVVVLPQARAGDAPIAMTWTQGRCTLVFAMRGNPAAESTLAAIPAPLLPATIEAMTAHEIGHCQRHRAGAFASLPRGLDDAPDSIEKSQPTGELKAIAHDMRVTRREEAYADLVGLAWTHSHHADEFAAVLAWFDRTRADDMPRGFHDTRHWLGLAHEADAFRDARSPFEQALALWEHGLADD